MNRIYVYPWDQLSKSAGAIAKGLDTSKILRKGSRYNPKEGDVIVNWGASDIQTFIDERIGGQPDPADKMYILNQYVTGALDKVVFFDRLRVSGVTPAYSTDRAAAEDFLKFPILCRTKTKGCDGDGIVIAESKIDLVPAKLYVELEPKTAEYRVHIGRNRDGSTSIMGVQQKFLPNGVKDKRLRTTANGCYFVWTLKGEPVENVCPPTVLAVTKAAFDLFPELDFVGADVIWNEATGKATVIEFNSAPEMTPQAVEKYVGFFQQFREEAQGPQQLDYAGEKLPVGELRDPIEDDRKPWKKAWAAILATAIETKKPIFTIEDAFHAGWDARKALEAPIELPPAAPYVNFMYGVRDGIDVV